MDTHEVKLTDAEEQQKHIETLRVTVEKLQEQFSKYYQVTEDAINALQQLISEVDDKNYKQEMKIQALTNRMHELSQDIKKLFSRIEDLQSHLDNGWRHDFINMLKRDYKQMVDETLKQALEMNKKQVEQLIQNMKDGYNAMMETYKIKQEKQTLDKTRFWISIIGGGGLVYLIIDKIFTLLVR